MTNVLDQAALDKIKSLGGDVLLRRTLDIFLEEAPEQAAKINSGFAAQDWKSVREGAHRLYPAAAMMGAGRLMEMCREVETRALEAQKDDLSVLLRKLDDEFQRVLQAVQKVRASL